MATSAADYCTLFPDRAFGKDWSNCCLAHDNAYGAAGSRIAADFELATCVAQTTGSEGLAGVMLIGVLAFGWIFRRKAKKGQTNGQA